MSTNVEYFEAHLETLRRASLRAFPELSWSAHVRAIRAGLEEGRWSGKSVEQAKDERRFFEEWAACQPE